MAAISVPVAAPGVLTSRHIRERSPMSLGQKRCGRPTRGLAALLLAIVWALPGGVLAAAADPAAAEFFEKEIRPLLAEKCQKCHGGSKPRAGLRLTARGLVLKGGDSGPA